MGPVIVEIVRCSGHCCREFHIPWSLKQIEQHDHEDTPIVSKMLIYVGESGPAKPGHLYNCKNLSASGDCSAYATRPAMCREFPYDGNRCPFKGCTRKAIEMEEHPTPWSMKMEGGEYVIRNANEGEVSRHKKKAEALTAFAAGKADDPPGEVVQIPPEGAAVEGLTADNSEATDGSVTVSEPLAATTPPSKSRKRGRRK